MYLKLQFLSSMLNSLSMNIWSWTCCVCVIITLATECQHSFTSARRWSGIHFDLITWQSIKCFINDYCFNSDYYLDYKMSICNWRAVSYLKLGLLTGILPMFPGTLILGNRAWESQEWSIIVLNQKVLSTSEPSFHYFITLFHLEYQQPYPKPT